MSTRGKSRRYRTEIAHPSGEEIEKWEKFADKFGYGNRQTLVRVAVADFIYRKEHPVQNVAQDNVVETFALEQELDRVNSSIAGVLARLDELDERGLNFQLRAGVTETSYEGQVLRLLELRGEPTTWSVLVEDAGTFGITEEELDATLEILMGDGLAYRDESGRWTLNGQ
ncbi:MAG: hypothetical protein ACTSU5_08670 [Promethearchaeota archaeon]